MPSENRTLLRKAEIAVADFTVGGLLQPAQTDKFIRLAIKQPVLLQRVTVTPMRAMKEERDKMRFANRVLRAGQEGTALPQAAWAKPNLGMVTLDAQLFKAEMRVTDEALEDQIERGVFRDTLVEELSKAIGRDMEYVCLRGDTGSADPVLAKLNGILRQITSFTTDCISGKLQKTILRDMYRTMPDEFAENPALEYFTNRQARLDYKDSLADRATPLGDTMVQTMGRVTWSDFPINSVPEFPVDGSSNTQIVLGDPRAIYLGFYRQVKIKIAEDISAGVIIVVASVRFDVKVAEELMFVRGYNLKGA